MTFWQNLARAKDIAGFVVAAGLAGAWLWQAQLANPATAAGISPIEKLVAENEINQQILRYTLLLDGDGVAKRDVRTWADKLFTEDAVFETYGPDGTMRNRQSGRDEIYRLNSQSAAFPPDISNRHFNVATYFDEVTATTAQVRTITTVVTVTRRKPTGCKDLGDDACGGKVVRLTSFTYHDTFTKTEDGWKKSHSVIRSDI